MRPRKPDGGNWAAGDSNRMLQHIDRQCTAELNEQDIARGLPKNLAPFRILPNGVYELVPAWVRAKHSGADQKALVKQRWDEFCSVPRDPATELQKIGSYADAVEPGPLHGFTPAIAQAIEQGIAAGVRAAMTVKEKS